MTDTPQPQGERSEPTVKEVIKVTQRDGYELRLERWEVNGETTEMESAYNAKGEYIGFEKNAHYLVSVRGIAPEARPGFTNCSIGFCEREQKWYGWSHRAMFGFGIGNDFFTDLWVDDLQPARKIETLDDAKQSAINYAEAVS